MASAGDNKITIINGDSISYASGVTDAQRYSNKLVVSKGLLTSDIISVSNPGKTLRNTNGATQSNSLLWELTYNGTGNIDAPTFSFYPYSTRINEHYFRIGTNDVIQGSTTWAADLVKLFDIYAGYPRNKLFWINIGMMTGQGVTSAQVDDFNTIAKTACTNYGIKYLDLKAKQVAKGDYIANCLLDGLHPNDAGHTFDAQQIIILQNEVVTPTTLQIYKRFKIA